MANLLSLLLNPFLGAVFLAACIIYLASHPSVQELRAVVITCGIAAIALSLFLVDLIANVSVFNISNFIFWVGSILALRLRLQKLPLRSIAYQPIRNTWLVCVYFPIFIVIAQAGLHQLSFFTPTTDDLFLHAIDGSLGFLPSFFLGQWFSNLPHTIQLIARLSYYFIAVVWAIVYINMPASSLNPFIKEFIMVSIIGLVLYGVMPTCGPAYTFFGWPWDIPPILYTPHTIPCAISFPRNGMPSLHTAWAFCLWRYAQQGSLGLRIFVSVWLLVLVVTMLGIGEHYLIDIVIGLTFAVAVRALCANPLDWFTSPRFWVLLINCGLLVIWFGIIHRGLALLRISPVIAWFCYLFTLVVTLFSERKLAQAQKLLSSPLLKSQTNLVL